MTVYGSKKSSLDANDTLRVSVDVTNSGNREGAEIVQLYVAKVIKVMQANSATTSRCTS